MSSLIPNNIDTSNINSTLENSTSNNNNNNNNNNSNSPERYNKLSTPELKQLFGQILNLEYEKINKSTYDKLKPDQHVSCFNEDITSPQSIYSKRFYMDIISVRNYLITDYDVRNTKNRFYLIRKNVDKQQLDKLNGELIELLASKKRKINTAIENQKVKKLKIDQQLNNEIQQLNNENQELIKKIEQLKQEDAHYQNTIIQFKNKEEDLKNQYQQLQIQSDNQYQELKKEMDQKSRQLDQYKATISSLEACFDEKNKKLDQITKERDEAIKMFQILECDIKKYEDAPHNSNNQNIVNLEESLKDVSKVVND
ncbi:hypothetical protein DICPUDRAFT_80724 [Dictyostelium purpureum]|uniref:Uncharacterized protein n=1 Tax=Dictyostelium purpureum TaxID=5786 RepID=F0ZRC0_DICPU|nr:uncharacterized protein DICPUDRAFT_80724 [Dictyostelium purpureum]EGC33500.1 hypothetical protein DICPUDRAFT_80724 [Dictyostelium purpureum]|eukprot:XP_003289974.1 hypothetical protein DICPUDRAFT_80724 [Dictyostelium purpureum]